MKRLRPLLLTILFPALFLLTAPLCHAGDFAPVTAQELGQQATAAQPGAVAVILLHEETDDDTMHMHSVHYKIKILTDAGRDRFSNVELPYDRSYTSVTDVKGRTTHADGSVAEFDGKVFDKLVEHGNGYKVHVKTFALPGVTVGSVIEYSYKLRYDDNIAYAPHWTLQSDLVELHEHFAFTPSQREIMMSDGGAGGDHRWTFLLPKGASVKRTQGYSHSLAGGAIVTYNVDLDNVPPYVEEEHSLPAYALKYRVDFFYSNEYESNKFWQNAGKEWRKRAEKFIASSQEISAAVASHTAATDTPEQKLHKLYAFVQSIPNDSYAQEKTSQEIKQLLIKEDKSAAGVLKNGHGDHDEINSLFAALARAAGMQSCLVSVSDRSERLFEQALHNWDVQLTNDVVIVPLDGKDIYLDPGTKFNPFGQLYWKYTMAGAVRETPDGGTALITTPDPVYTESETRRTGRFQLNAKGEISGHLQIVYVGREALSHRLYAVNSDVIAVKKRIEEEVRNVLGSSASVELTGTPAWESADKTLALDFTVTAPALVHAGHKLLLPINLFAYNEAPLFVASQRRTPVRFYYPSQQYDTIVITLDPSFAVDSLPADITFDLPYAGYESLRRNKGNVLQSVRSTVLAVVGFDDLSTYKEVKEFADKMKKADSDVVVLKVNDAAAH